MLWFWEAFSGELEKLFLLDSCGAVFAAFLVDFIAGFCFFVSLCFAEGGGCVVHFRKGKGDLYN